MTKKNYLLLGLLVGIFLLALLSCSSSDDNSKPEEPEQKEEPRPDPAPYDVKVDGICYKLVNRAGIARITPGDVYYAGNVVIPDTIVYDGIVYRVEEMADYSFSGCKNPVVRI